MAFAIRLQQAAVEDMTLVADALDLQVSASNHASLVGNPAVFTHHWTNMGVSAPPCVCAADRLVLFRMDLALKQPRSSASGVAGAVARDPFG